jgi:hypothetical protein
VHLTVLADIANVGVVRDEREAPWPPLRLREPEASRDNRAKSIGADDDRSPNLTAFSIH